jgi:hypothetical protein
MPRPREPHLNDRPERLRLPGKPFVNDIDNARFAGAEFGREGSAGSILARLLIFSC